MTHAFLKNISYMTFGTIILLSFALVSGAVYIRTIGVEGYAIIGLVSSFFLILRRLNVPFFLVFIKGDNPGPERTPTDIGMAFNTCYGFVWITNMLLFLLLFPLVGIVSEKIYVDLNLMPYFLIALCGLLLSRVNFLMTEFFRSQRSELTIQYASIVGSALEVTVSFFCLFMLHLGVFSVFIGALIGETTNYCLLIRAMRKKFRIQSKISIPFMTKSFRHFVVDHYISRALTLSIPSIGLLIASFSLDLYSIGILSILVSIVNQLQGLFLPLGQHLSPVYAKYLQENNIAKIRTTIGTITTLSLFLFLLSNLFFLIVGKQAYHLYYAGKIDAFYSHFLLVIITIFLWFSQYSQERYLFISNTKLHTYITMISAAIFLVFLFVTPNYHSIALVVWSFVTYYFIRTCLFLYLSIRTLGTSLLSRSSIIFAGLSLVCFVTMVAYGARSLDISHGLVVFIVFVSLLLAFYWSSLHSAFKHVRAM